MGKKNAEAYGIRNSGEGAVLVRIKPTRIIAEKVITSWDYSECFLNNSDIVVAVGSHNSATKTHGKWEGAEV
jgi:hypothetical protein